MHTPTLVSPAPTVAEKLLVQRLLARDESALADFYDAYGPALFRVILRLVRCPETAEDVLQDSLVKLWASFGNYNPQRGRLYTWARNICEHQAIDHLRAARSRGAGRMDSWDDCPAIPERTAWMPEHLDVHASLNWLRPAYRQVLELRYFQGFTQEETAEELGLPLGTVKTHCRNALRELALCFRCPPSIACEG